ncbi:MAG TPA: LptA/OstA family protein, partial [Thermoanaerobaculia bacterium]
NGEAIAIVARGEKALPHATLLGPPRRDITAKAFRVGVEGSLVKELRAEGEVRVVEPAPAARTLTANSMIVFFDPATRKVGSSVVDGQIRYRDPKNQATGEHANYYAKEDVVIFTSVPGSAPSVTTEGHELTANKIEFWPKQAMVRASTNVIARLNPKQKSATASETALFPDGAGPVFVNAGSLMIRQALKLAVFSGNVRAGQGTNTLLADEMQVLGAGETLQAKGHVRAVLYNARGGARKSPMSVKANQLIAKKAESRVALDGNVQIEDEGRVVEASHAVIFLDANRKIERVEARDGVVLTERATGRNATGDRVDYRVQQKMIYLEGMPAQLTDARGTIKGRRVVFDIAKNKVDVVSGETPTEATYIPD